MGDGGKGSIVGQYYLDAIQFLEGSGRGHVLTSDCESYARCCHVLRHDPIGPAEKACGGACNGVWWNRQKEDPASHEKRLLPGKVNPEVVGLSGGGGILAAHGGWKRAAPNDEAVSRSSFLLPPKFSSYF